jgi:hypothetical protein
MDCIDCHNRPAHIYQMPEDVVDFGLLSKAINPVIPGIREDSLIAISGEYATRDEASEKIGPTLMELQYNRSGDEMQQYRAAIEKAGKYLVEGYLGNVWPETEVLWGTYKSHLGHQFEEEGYGCFRCHDEMHENNSGKVIKQDCDLCHDEPE